MLTIINNAARVKKLQAQFRRELFAAADSAPATREFGAPGNRWNARVVRFKKGNWWYAYAEFTKRYGNTLGLGDPVGAGKKQFSPVAELNPSRSPPSRKCQGAFAEDDAGKVFIVHRGRLGGGKKNIGKGFLAWYPKHLRRLVDDDDRTADVIVVGRLGHPKLVDGVRAFLGLAHAYRQGHKPSAPYAATAANTVYSDEATGKSKYKTEREIVVEWRHGRVVKALNAQLKKLGVTGHKDKKRDLFTMKRGKQAILFEVKASGDTQSIYTAVGQLAWHAAPGTRRVAVLPATTPHELKGRLEQLGISVLSYTWHDEKPRVEGVKELLAG